MNKRYKLHKCEYEKCENMTTNGRFCSLKCSGHVNGHIGGKRTQELYLKEMKEWGRKGGKRLHELHPNLASEMGKRNIHKSLKTLRKEKKGFWDSKIQSMNGKKAAITNKRNGTGFYDPKIQSKGGVASQHTLRKNHRNLKYKGQYYDSLGEIEISMCLMCQFNYKPKENKTFHIRMIRGEVDYLLGNLKLFIEFHQYFRNETYEEYCIRRQKLLDDNGYKDYKLVVIK